MGLDLVPEGCAKAGCEAEWRGLVGRAFRGEQLSDAETKRFNEVSIPAYERAGAPRVGYDAAADAWIIEARKAVTSEEKAAVLEEFNGYYVLRLAKCAGVPSFSHGQLYEGVDETSFRGAFLKDCDQVLDQATIDDAWEHKFPDEAIEYGQMLLSKAQAAAAGHAPEKAKPKKGLLARLGLGKRESESIPISEQLEIVRAAGEWFVFWGERGHPIRAWF